jgi:integrase
LQSKIVQVEQRIKTGSSKYVFPNSKGEMYLGDNVFNRLFLPVRNACGIGHFTFKDLRHTFSTSLVTNGVDPKRYKNLWGILYLL